jgi:hypothetical protein
MVNKRTPRDERDGENYLTSFGTTMSDKRQSREQYLVRDGEKFAVSAPARRGEDPVK